MCCFSGPVELVSGTSIFARSDNGRQLLVYSMTYASVGDVAMVLPLPVPPNPADDAVRFINLERYPDFFADMRKGFPTREVHWRSAGLSLAVAGPTLEVHQVGKFEASFVPRIDDFDRLDERFRIPPHVWSQLPAYRDFGFAVFKLKGTAAAPSASSSSSEPSDSEGRPPGFWRQWTNRAFGRQSEAPGLRPAPPRPQADPLEVHPMAFEFPRRNPDLLYFPTVHIHDRQVHPHAYFDHTLYCQPDSGMEKYLKDWTESEEPAGSFMDCGRTEGIVLPGLTCWKCELNGQLKNEDTTVGAGGSIPVVVA